MNSVIKGVPNVSNVSSVDDRKTIAVLRRFMTVDEPTAFMVKVSPAIAVWLLEFNWDQNRKLQQSTVDKYANEVRHGHWTVTGDTVKVSTDGMIIDGQHRLWGVIEADLPIETMMCFGIDKGVAFKNIDGGSGRSVAFRSNLARPKTSALNFLIALGYGKAEATPSNLQIIDKVYGKAVDGILALQLRHTRVVTRAETVAAAAIWWKAGREGYTTDIYSALIELDSGALPPIARSFLRQCVVGTSRTPGATNGGLQTFLRAFKMFDPAFKDIRKIQFKDGTSSLEVARNMIQKAFADSHVTFDAVPIKTGKMRGRM